MGILTLVLSFSFSAKGSERSYKHVVSLTSISLSFVTVSFYISYFSTRKLCLKQSRNLRHAFCLWISNLHHIHKSVVQGKYNEFKASWRHLAYSACGIHISCMEKAKQQIHGHAINV